MVSLTLLMYMSSVLVLGTLKSRAVAGPRLGMTRNRNARMRDPNPGRRYSLPHSFSYLLREMRYRNFFWSKLGDSRTMSARRFSNAARVMAVWNLLIERP